MKIICRVAFFLMTLAFTVVPAVAGDGEDAEKPLVMKAGPPGGQWHELGKRMEVLFREQGVHVVNQVGGGVDNLRLVGEGEADIGFTLYSFMGAAGAGEAELPRVNLDNALLLCNLYPQVLYLIVRKDVADQHGIHSLGDLLRVREALRFSTLPKGTGSEFIFNMLLKSAYRTSYEKLAEQGWQVDFRSYADITEMFLSGNLDVCAYTAGPSTYLIPLLEEQNLNAVLLPVEEEMLDLMTHQFMTVTHVIDKDDYKSIETDVVTLGDYSSLVVRSGVSDDIVYRINQIIWEERPELGRISQDIESLSPRFAIAGQSRVHPGSVRFWNSEAMQRWREENRR